MGSLQKSGQFHGHNRQVTRRRTGNKHKVEKCATPIAGFDYLNFSFSSVWNSHPLNGNQAEIEQAFFMSLTFLESLYGFKVSRKSELPFPRNITAIIRTALKKIEKDYPGTTLFITIDDNRAPCLCTAETYEVKSSTLYYIPISPLYKLCQNDQHNHRADLLLSVFAYLYQVVGINYYRDKSSFLYYCYSEIKTWLSSEEEQNNESEEYFSGCQQQLEDLKIEGDFILEKIRCDDHLKQFENRLRGFIRGTKSDQLIFEVASSAFDLFKTFPHTKLSDCIPEGFLESDIEDRITTDQYVSFFWDAVTQPLDDHLMSWVNSYFENCAVMDLPTIYQRFDVPHKTISHDITFAASLFPMIEKLTETLIELT